MSARGMLIAVEGGEGAGKSTQAPRLAAALGAELSREPGGSPLGERIRELLLDPSLGHGSDEGTAPVDARAELLLMLAARAQHLAERIVPALEGGRHVVVDRFSGSTLAYQGYGRGLPLDEVRAACDVAAGGLWPDLNVLLDVSVAVGANRRSRAGGWPDRIEDARGGFHERVVGGFREIAEADAAHWVRLDGDRGVDEVARDVLDTVSVRLGLVPVRTS